MVNMEASSWNWLGLGVQTETYGVMGNCSLHLSTFS